ncbi:AraC family transcriptional regulator [Sphingobacterium sp. lm-10]|uniref:AraC family transcriptional regulator n=1 Tax=Sphingobacterium sp. lm-10 TaxID=2944904 RepID=UPI002020E893|nr:AraC family transcriptional regulator [Sphingobacterium sp. lm-10]MCL7987920.1 AraC family transcriptional regulator [Sphingobacterium sp. lm-10]
MTNSYVNKYYITEVDVDLNSIYCHHAVMGEEFIDTHDHRKGQFLYTEGGMVFLKTAEKSYFLPARHYIWIPAGVKHSIHPSSPEVIMRNLYFPSFDTDGLFFNQVGIYPVNDLLMELIMYTNRWNGHILPEDKKNYTIAKAFKLLLPELSSSNLSLSLPYPKNTKLREMVSFLEEHISELISFKDLANKFHFSERTLARLFQKDLGMSFIQYYTILRMLTALKYLLNEKMSVQQVAARVGYSSLPTFSNTFFKIVGVRPSEYVKNRESII